MNDFEFISPTKIYFGKDKHLQIGTILKNYNFNNVLLIYGQSSIQKNGIYNEIINSLKNEKINVIERSGICANPKLSWIKKCKNSLKNEKIDMILAVGGGSVIDSGKLLSHYLINDVEPFDYNLGKLVPKKSLPLGVILTIASAGSEMSNSCVISNDEVTPFIKKGFNCDANRPLFAILNPKLTYSVNTFQTGCGIVDTLMHTLERFMNKNDDCMLSTNFAIALLKTVLYYGKRAILNPYDEQARSELMLASSLSHNGLTSLGKKQLMRVHGLEHILSGFHDDIAHGAGLSILWCSWCKVALKHPKANQLLTLLAKELFNKETAIEGIDALEQYFKDIHMPTRFSDLSIAEPLDINGMAKAYILSKSAPIDDFIDIDENCFIQIFSEVL